MEKRPKGFVPLVSLYPRKTLEFVLKVRGEQMPKAGEIKYLIELLLISLRISMKRIRFKPLQGPADAPPYLRKRDWQLLRDWNRLIKAACRALHGSVDACCILYKKWSTQSLELLGGKYANKSTDLWALAPTLCKDRRFLLTMYGLGRSIPQGYRYERPSDIQEYRERMTMKPKPVRPSMLKKLSLWVKDTLMDLREKIRKRDK